MTPWWQGFMVGATVGTVVVLLVTPWLVQLYVWYLELVLGKESK